MFLPELHLSPPHSPFFSSPFLCSGPCVPLLGVLCVRWLLVQLLGVCRAATVPSTPGVARTTQRSGRPFWPPFPSHPHLSSTFIAVIASSASRAGAPDHINVPASLGQVSLIRPAQPARVAELSAFSRLFRGSPASQAFFSRGVSTSNRREQAVSTTGFLVLSCRVDFRESKAERITPPRPHSFVLSNSALEG